VPRRTHFWPFTEVLQEIRPDITRKVWGFWVFTEANEGNEDFSRDCLGLLQKVMKKPGIYPKRSVFLQKGTQAMKEQGKFKLRLPAPEFFTEGNEGNEGRSGPGKIQSLFSSLSSV
jgi:hypothetical protein